MDGFGKYMKLCVHVFGRDTR